MTKQEIEDNLLAADAELKETRRQLKPLATAWAVADQAYRRAQAIAQLAASGTIPEKKAHVDKVCSEEMLAAHSAKAVFEAAKLSVGAMQTEISVYQTLAKLMIAEMQQDGRYDT